MSGGVPSGIVPGAIIGGKYRVERTIARGGQGTVVEATHLALRQPVAIKFSHVDGPRKTEGMQRLLQEARAAVRLRGPHVARVIDVDVCDGAPFIVMEYLQGIDLKALIASRGPLPCPEAVGFMLQACEGVAEAHDLGIIHRDLKPSNLFLVEAPGGAPLLKVLDFGIAKNVSPQAAIGEDLELTEPLVLLGSPGYISPEQARDPRQADARADIWSLGLILQELLTGRPVFRARTRADVLALVLLKNPTPISLLRSDVPQAIERVILRCLQKAPEHRFASVRELAEQLAPFAAPVTTGTTQILAPAVRATAAPRRPPGRLLGLLSAAAALSATAALVAVVVANRLSPRAMAPAAAVTVPAGSPPTPQPPPAALAQGSRPATGARPKIADATPISATTPSALAEVDGHAELVATPALPSGWSRRSTAHPRHAAAPRAMVGKHRLAGVSSRAPGRSPVGPSSASDDATANDPLDGRK